MFSLPRMNSEMSMQFIWPENEAGFKTPNPQILLFFSPGEPPDASWPTAKVGLISYVPSKVSSQVWRLLVDLSAVWIVAQVHCWLPSRPIHVDLKMIWWSFLFNWCKELKSPARVHAQGTSTSFTFSVNEGRVKTVLAQFELPCIHPSLSTPLSSHLLASACARASWPVSPFITICGTPTWSLRSTMN